MDVFDRMPYMMVAVSPNDYKLIRVSDVARQGDGPVLNPMIKILYLATYAELPSREDIQDLYAMLWEMPEYNLVQTEIVLLRPPECVRDHIVQILRLDGRDFDQDVIEFVQPLHLIH